MTENELKELFQNEQVLEYLKKNININLSVDACENTYGYDITASVYLGDELLAEADDCI